LIFRKIIRIVATSCQILEVKMYKIRFRLGLRPRPHLRSLHGLSWPPGCIYGALLLRGGRGRGGEGKRRRKGGSKKKFAPPNLHHRSTPLSVAQVVFEILRSKRIGVTSLTFQGHVTSSITWPFCSPYAISYWWSFGTKLLSLTVSEIFNVTLIRPLNKGQGHSFWYQSISHIWLPIGSQ